MKLKYEITAEYLESLCINPDALKASAAGDTSKLGWAFTWDQTEEGWHFWYDIRHNNVGAKPKKGVKIAKKLWKAFVKLNPQYDESEDTVTVELEKGIGKTKVVKDEVVTKFEDDGVHILTADDVDVSDYEVTKEYLDKIEFDAVAAEEFLKGERHAIDTMLVWDSSKEGSNFWINAFLGMSEETVEKAEKVAQRLLDAYKSLNEQEGSVSYDTPDYLTKQYLEDIEFNYENAKKFVSGDKFICTCFSWTETIEGWAYWSDVDDRENVKGDLSQAKEKVTQMIKVWEASEEPAEDLVKAEDPSPEVKYDREYFGRIYFQADTATSFLAGNDAYYSAIFYFDRSHEGDRWWHGEQSGSRVSNEARGRILEMLIAYRQMEAVEAVHGIANAMYEGLNDDQKTALGTIVNGLRAA